MDGTGSTWKNQANLLVGRDGNGMLDITNGGTVISHRSSIGLAPGSTGTVTVDGTRSTYSNDFSLDVGNGGNGTLIITNGGSVTAGPATFVSRTETSTGQISFDNGTLTTMGLFCNTDDLIGTGTINTGGLVSDVDLVFDTADKLNQTFHISSNPGQNITIHLSVDGSSPMGAGYSSVGTTSIIKGTIVESISGVIGYKTGSMGIVNVEGAGSTWGNSSNLSIGFYGNSKLNITSGGTVSNINGYIASRASSSSKVSPFVQTENGIY